MTKQSDRDEAATASEGGTDPLASRNEDLTNAGGPLAGKPGAGGTGFGAGEPQKGHATPSGKRAVSDAPIASDVAPIVHTSMDDEVRAVEAGAHRSTRPGADG